ncbi:MAG: ATP-binding protein [Acidobacteriota bacterium]|nr:MAG: ATP-binding protein [Acidobacteriota bacterium]
MNKKLLALYGLKYNPFSSELPIEALHTTAKIDSFLWRVENQVGEGGFCLVTGEPGTGKSVILRLLSSRLASLHDVTAGVLTRPQASAADFYRELGYLFGVELSPHNRWRGAQALRERWLAHIESSLFRPVLLVDEGQEMQPGVLGELRLLSSTDLDARSILTVVLSGDRRLAEKLRTPELLPLGSRIRVRLTTEYAGRDELAACLKHVLRQAGSPKLVTDELASTLCEHAAGNYRVLMNLGHELLLGAVEREAESLDEKLFFEVFSLPETRPRKVRAR